MKMPFQICVTAILAMLAVPAVLPARDLSRYREFHLGSSPVDVARLAGIKSPETILISSRPERIEELDWSTNLSIANAARPDSVREIRFRFYNGALFEIMVSYDSDQTNGLTDADMTEALSTVYGPPSPVVTKEMTFNSGYSNTVQAIAQWGDEQNVLILVGFTSGGGYGVIASSTRDQELARRAMAESERLDHVEAPQRALDRKAKQVADDRARDEKSRLVNKPRFRP